MEGAISNRSSLFAFHASFEVQQLLGVSMETNSVVPLIGTLGAGFTCYFLAFKGIFFGKISTNGWILVGIYFLLEHGTINQKEI